MATTVAVISSIIPRFYFSTFWTCN